MIPDRLSRRLRGLVEYELSLRNAIERCDGEPLNVYFRESLHFVGIERDLSLPGTVVRERGDTWEGYLCRFTRQHVWGPSPLQGDPAHSIPELSPVLQRCFDEEIARGNTVLRVDRDPYDGRVAVRFTNPLAVELPTGAERWESWDTRHSREAGFRCVASRHSLAGPHGDVPDLTRVLDGFSAEAWGLDLEGHELAPIPAGRWERFVRRSGTGWEASIQLWTQQPGRPDTAAETALTVHVRVGEDGVAEIVAAEGLDPEEEEE